MANAVEEHFLAVVRPAFPRHADFHIRGESGDICIYVDWKLDNDPARPNKRSKKIKICISGEAVEDYANADNQNQKGADERLLKAVSGQLRAFSPDHNLPAHVPVPIEQWTITSQMINE